MASSLTQANNFHPVRCEFCELELKCDFDVSRHLVSEKHRKSMDQFLAVQNQVDKTIQKDIPKRLDQVFHAIKVRDVKDLKDLADKGFFEVNDESIAEIGQRLALSLFKAYVEYTSRDAPPRIASKFVETVVDTINDHDNAKTAITSNTASSNQIHHTSTSKQANTSAEKDHQVPLAAPTPVVEKQTARTTTTVAATTPQVYRPGPASVLAKRSGQAPQVVETNRAQTQPKSTKQPSKSQTKTPPDPKLIRPLPGTVRVEAVPKPIEQSTYKIQFAKIKDEPKE